MFTQELRDMPKSKRAVTFLLSTAAGSMDGTPFLWVQGNNQAVIMGCRLLRALLNLYRDDTLPGLRLSRASCHCTETDADLAYNNYMRECDQRRLVERERRQVVSGQQLH